MSLRLPNPLEDWMKQTGEWHYGRTTANELHVKNVEKIVKRGSPAVAPVNGERHGSALEQGLIAVMTSPNIYPTGVNSSMMRFAVSQFDATIAPHCNKT